MKIHRLRLHLNILDVQWPIGQSFLIALLILCSTLGLFELAARLPFVINGFPASAGGYHYELGTKLERADKLVKAQHGLDCLFVGSSAVSHGIDPERFSHSYKQQTGQKITCFNFGLYAVKPPEAKRLIPILVARYHPRLVIYGLAVNDLAGVSGFSLDIPWVKYQEGQFSLEGYLTDHSFAYRRYLAHQAWLSSNYWNDVSAVANIAARTTDYGMVNSPSNPEAGTKLPDRNIYEDAYRELDQPQFQDENVRSLDNIAAFQQQGTRIILVEIPFSPMGRYFYSDGEKVYAQYLEVLRRTAHAHGTEFYELGSLKFDPELDWTDYFHLSTEGAYLISDWLGGEIGLAVKEHTLDLSMSAQP